MQKAVKKFWYPENSRAEWLTTADSFHLVCQSHNLQKWSNPPKREKKANSRPFDLINFKIFCVAKWGPFLIWQTELIPRLDSELKTLKFHKSWKGDSETILNLAGDVVRWDSQPGGCEFKARLLDWTIFTYFAGKLYLLLLVKGNNNRKRGWGWCMNIKYESMENVFVKKWNDTNEMTQMKDRMRAKDQSSEEKKRWLDHEKEELAKNEKKNNQLKIYFQPRSLDSGLLLQLLHLLLQARISLPEGDRRQAKSSKVSWLFQRLKPWTCGQSYKAFTSVNYDSRVYLLVNFLCL